MKKALLLLAALLILSGCVARLDKTSEFLQYKDKARIAQIETLCAEYFDKNGVVGMSVGVLEDGRVRFFNYGVTEEGGRAIGEDTRFDLGSLTEIFTGAVYSESIYRRYLSKYSPLDEIFPYLRLPEWSDGTSLTFDRLATHRSGMPQTPSGLSSGGNPYAEYDEQALRRFIASSELESKPGEVYNPGGIDMGLLGFAVEVARKVPFESHTKSVIMYAIGMSRTTVTIDEDDTSARATPHDASGRPLEHQEYASLQGMAAFKSTAYDLLLFTWCNMDMPGTEGTFTKDEAQGMPIGDQLYLSVEEQTDKERILKIIGAQSAVERLHASMTIAQDVHYTSGGLSLGYGFKIGEMDGSRYIWQTGGSDGGSGYVGFVPDKSTGVVILANSPADVQTLAEQIFAILK